MKTRSAARKERKAE